MAVEKKSEEFISDSDSGEEIEDHAFEAPKGYEKVALKSPKTQIKDKEIWLIKKPKGFPLEKLKSLPVSFTANKINSSKAAEPVEVDGHKFQVNEDHFVSDNNAKYTLLNDSLKDSKIDRYYTIREVIDIPNIDFNKVHEARSDIPQIEGLRMRHFATGYGAKDFPEAQANESKQVKRRKSDEEAPAAKKAKSDQKEPKAKSEQKDPETKDKKPKEKKRDRKGKKDKKDKKEKKH